MSWGMWNGAHWIEVDRRPQFFFFYLHHALHMIWIKTADMMHIRHGGIWCTCPGRSINGWIQLRKGSGIPSHICLADVCGYIHTYTDHSKTDFFFLSVFRHQRYLWICKAATVENAHRSMPSHEVMIMSKWQKKVTKQLLGWTTR